MKIQDWQVSAILVIGGLAIAIGFSTPQARIAALEASSSDHEKRISKVEDNLSYIRGKIDQALKLNRGDDK